jgi:kynurenine formamidase
MSGVLAQLVDELNRGRVRVIDLTQPLGPSTPVIGLPPMFAPSPGVTMDVISKYDDKGPAWYWNTIRMGEHTDTHFDAPVHWITGKDLPNSTCDTIPVSRFVGPACVIDVSGDVARDPDFLLTVERLEAWEADHGRVPPGAWVLMRTGWSRRTDAASFVNAREDGPHSPGFDARTSKVLAEDRRDDRDRCRPGRDVQSAVSESRDDARCREVRAGEPVQPRPVAADGRGGHRGAAQDRQRQRQSASCDRARAGIDGGA